jgi:hypothetical protein
MPNARGGEEVGGLVRARWLPGVAVLLRTYIRHCNWSYPHLALFVFK